MGSGRFDEVIDRYNTNSEKYDFKTKFGKPEDVLPLWVADMDFRAPEEVLEALHKAVSHGIFGYSESGDDYFQALEHWFFNRFGWKIDQEWLLKSPGVVFGIHAMVRGLTNEGDAVMIQPPVYYPFFKVVEDNHRKLVCNRLVHKESGYEIDFEDFEDKIITEKVKLFIFCSPHNPIGRVWRREELERILSICIKHDVLIISDEIHCDFTYPGHKHIVFATLSEEAKNRCLICTAPSKTFNLAGLQTSNLLIPNQELRRKVRKALYTKTGYQELNQLGLVACQAAYENGAVWLEECKDYLKENLDYLREFLREKIPQIRLVEPEGTYLVWLDCRGLGLSDEDLEDLITNKARLWLSAGSKFDPECGQYERVNIACPKRILEQAMNQLEIAVKGVLS